MTLAQAELTMKNAIEPIFGAAEALSIVRIVREDVLHLRNGQRNAHAVLPEAQIDLLQSIAARLAAGEPLQYILGVADFFGYQFKVTPSVLIPRMETEELVDIAIKSIKLKPNATVLDMCTGSGCIAISIAKKCSNAQLFATDISQEALKIAQENNSALHTNVHFVVHDACSDQALLPHIRWDVIVSNPPYIPFAEQSVMPKWVLEHEPHLALFVNNDEPLVFYEKIITFAAKYLKPEGILLMECNQYNAQSIRTLPDVVSHFEGAAIIQDLSGNDRIFQAKIKKSFEAL